jgi:hypothetical protein
MATPVNDSYSAPPGGSIHAGRYRFPAAARVSIWGQSNALGRALRTDVSASPLSADAGLAAFDAGTFDRVWIWTGAAYAKLQPAVNNGASAGEFGPEFGLGARWMRETTSGNLYLEKHAFSGVSIDPHFTPGNYYYNLAVTERTQADAWLATNSISLIDSGWLWVQGESDAGQSQSWYQTRLESLIAGRTTDGFQDAATKRILMKMHPSTSTYGAGPSAAKDAVASASPSTTSSVLMPYYMNADNIHLNGRGQVQLGYDAFEHIFGVAHKSA